MSKNSIKIIFYKRPLFFASMIIIAIGSSSIASNIEKKKSYDRGQNVYAEMISAPSTCEDLNKTSMIELKYMDHIYKKKVGVGFCDQLSLKKILVRIDLTGDRIFFLNEKIEEEILFAMIILFLGIIIATIGWKKKI